MTTEQAAQLEYIYNNMNNITGKYELFELLTYQKSAVTANNATTTVDIFESHDLKQGDMGTIGFNNTYINLLSIASSTGVHTELIVDKLFMNFVITENNPVLKIKFGATNIGTDLTKVLRAYISVLRA